MSEIGDLKPTSRTRVIDLVSEAGHDVSDWSNFERGPRYAAVNPRYCYEWCFSQDGKATILNMWYANVREHQGKVVIQANIRASIEAYGKRAKNVWRMRARRLDDAIRIAAHEEAVVRVIVNDGRMRSPNDPKARASSVSNRLLDTVPWFVAHYDTKTGEFTLERGPWAHSTVDQFDVNSEETTLKPFRELSVKVKDRDPYVREAVKERAGGRCELCNRLGFTRPDGSIYLETHHVVPLADGGPDVISNVVALCANHHREAHHGARAEPIRALLLGYLSKVGRGLTRR